MNYFLQRITALVPLLLCITVTSVVIAQENVEPDENASMIKLRTSEVGWNGCTQGQCFQAGFYRISPI